MRALVHAVTVLVALATHSTCALSDPVDAAVFWKSVQATCDSTAAKPASDLGRRIAQTAIDEFTYFGGHQIDSNGRLIRFGLTAAESEDQHTIRAETLSQRSWRRVMTYWRALYGEDAPAKLEARGYGAGALLRATAAELMQAVDNVSDPGLREILHEAILRAAVIDTPWSAAFISYVMEKSGVTANTFQFSNAHRTYIYNAFAVSATEVKGGVSEQLYRACPLSATKPRVGDLICNQREPSLAEASEQSVRERIGNEVDSKTDARSVRRSHCEVVAFIDASASKMYTVGGNILHGVAARKLNLRQPDLKFSAAQRGVCNSSKHWALPQSDMAMPVDPNIRGGCSLNASKWFILLQLR